MMEASEHSLLAIRNLDRRDARKIASETLDICRKGWYYFPRNDNKEGGQQRVEVDSTSATQNTQVIESKDELPVSCEGFSPSSGEVAQVVVEVRHATTLGALEDLWKEEGAQKPICALNFASARNPGGGFLNGALAQEESLARSSTLYVCLTGARHTGAFYQSHENDRRCVYSDCVIWTPQVPVFRRDDGSFLPKPYPVNFLTCAAPNAAVARRRGVSERRLNAFLLRRSRRILQVAQAKGQRRLVLGAWGCGVFGNDPYVAAECWRDLLIAPQAEFANSFDRVVFAITDEVMLECFRQVLCPSAAEEEKHVA